MDFGFDDKTSLVTGGGGCIGSEDCETLAREGAEIIVLDVDLDSAETVAEGIREDGGTASAVECDLTDRDEVEDTVGALREETGGIDVLINNTGITRREDRSAPFLAAVDRRLSPQQ